MIIEINMITEILLLTLLIEIATIASRALFGSAQKFYTKNRIPIRIHHGYIGLALIALYILFPVPTIFIVTGTALFLADLIHHFIVLPILVGRREI